MQRFRGIRPIDLRVKTLDDLKHGRPGKTFAQAERLRARRDATNNVPSGVYTAQEVFFIAIASIVCTMFMCVLIFMPLLVSHAR